METAKLKILYVLTAGGVGGAQRYVSDLVSSLPKDRFEATVLAGGRDVKWLSNRVSPLFLFNDWFAVAELARTFRRERPHIIHLNSSKAGVVGSLAAFLYNWLPKRSDTPRARVVFTAHGWAMNPSNHPSRLTRICYALLHRAAAHFVDMIINVSQADYDIAVRHRIAPAHKLTMIRNGIDPSINFLDRETARKEILKKLTTSYFWIGSIGRFVKEKDYATLIRAASETPDAYFFLIGEGPEYDNLKHITKNLKLADRVFFVPPTGNDATFIKAFDVFVLSSIKEGLPYTALEAVAAGLPVVGTAVGGLPEIAARCPNVHIVPPRNPQALSIELKRALTKTYGAPCVPFALLEMTAQTKTLYEKLTEPN